MTAIMEGKERERGKVPECLGVEAAAERLVKLQVRRGETRVTQVK